MKPTCSLPIGLTKEVYLLNIISGMNTEENKPEAKNRLKLWLKRLGFAGFLFFLAKGMLWLAVIFGATKCFE